MGIPRLRSYGGPAVLSYGFRPFFLLGSFYAGLAILAWLPMFHGQLELVTTFAPRDWHVHEMLYGYLPAVITGFLLTAVPNWTGRLPLQGKPLLALVLIWVAGRVAVTASAWIGWMTAAAVDLAFLLVVAVAIAREIVAGRNWRNRKILIVFGVLFGGNLTFHLEAHMSGAAEYGVRIGISATVILVMLIGGRIVPSFTRNWLSRVDPGRLPVPFGRFDVVSMIVAAAAVGAWCVAAASPATATALVVAGLLQAARLARWAGYRTWRNPLVLVLLVAYAFLPFGFLLVGASALSSIPLSAGIHAWTGGAFGGMTIAVMSRASLGHTGRALVASRAVEIVYALIFVATIARVCAALEPQLAIALLPVAGLAWATAFLGFALAYWRVFHRAQRERLSGPCASLLQIKEPWLPGP